MSDKISTDLLYEPKRIEGAWYEIDPTKINGARNERIQKLETLSQMGYVTHWYHIQRHCELYGITDKGRMALRISIH
jgi:hypothetical protein